MTFAEDITIFPGLVIEVKELDFIFLLQRHIAVVFKSIERAFSGDSGFANNNLMFEMGLQEIKDSFDCIDVSGGELSRCDYEVRLYENFLFIAYRSEDIVFDFLQCLIYNVPAVIAFYKRDFSRACGAEYAVLFDPWATWGGFAEGGAEVFSSEGKADSA